MDFILNIYKSNSLRVYVSSLLLFFAVYIGLIICRKILDKWLKKLVAKTKTDLDDFAVDLMATFGGYTYFIIALYVSSRNLKLPYVLLRGIYFIFIMTITIQVIRILQKFLGFWLRKIYVREKDDNKSESVLQTITLVINWVLWGAGFIFFLDNVGVNVSAAIAGLGIGGVAVALAAQTILGDLFSSFSILLDKPFRIGDFIIVGDMLGCVEHIGIKTTRIRSLSGEQLVFSNSDLTNSRIRNYKKMQERRILFSFGVLYQTPYEKVKQIPGFIREIIESIDNTRFDRAHFKAYGNSSLDFEVVYYVLNPDYNVYMDIQQEINLKIMKKFKEEKIDFAYPTQTLYIEKNV